MGLRTWGTVAILCLGVATAGCTRQPDHAARDSDTAAHKAGKTAYKVADKAKDAADKAARELGRAARQAQEGWSEAARESKNKPENRR
jgi:hypothetical protein